MRQSFDLGRLSLVFALLLSAGCISVQNSPQSRFYSLQPIKGNVAVSEAGALGDLMVGVGPITLPEYFNRPQIVTRKSDDTLEFAQFERWAEPLDKAIARVVSQNLGILLPKLNVQTYPWNSVLPVRYQVIVDVFDLDSRLDKEVAASLQWSIIDSRNKKVLQAQRTDLRIPVGSRTYSGLVTATSVLCESLSREVAIALAETAAKAPVE